MPLAVDTKQQLHRRQLLREEENLDGTMPDSVTKAVLLARGLGKRMRLADPSARLANEQVAAADAGMKAMISVGRPFLDFVLSALADAGIRKACIVVGPEHTGIREYYDSLVRDALQSASRFKSSHWVQRMLCLRRKSSLREIHFLSSIRTTTILSKRWRRCEI